MRTRTFPILAAASVLALVPTIAFAASDYEQVEWATPLASTEQMPTNADDPIWPQTIATDATCGVYLQVDRYLHSEVTVSLIVAGVLNGPAEDGGLLDYEHPFDSTGQPWQFIKAPDCVEPEPSAEPSVTPEPACGPIGSCGEVPTYVDETPKLAPVDVTRVADAADALPAVPVVADVKFAG